MLVFLADESAVKTLVFNVEQTKGYREINNYRNRKINNEEMRIIGMQHQKK
jgi:hypothetical protein